MSHLDGVLNGFDLERDDLDFKCPRKIADRIADDVIEEWYLVGRALNVSEKKLKSIHRNNTLSLPEEKSVAILDAWSEENGKAATCLKLAEALYRRKKKSVLETLCKEVARMKSDAPASRPSTTVSHQPRNNQQQQEQQETRQEDQPKYNEDDLITIVQSKGPIPTPHHLRETVGAFLKKVVILLHTVKDEEMLAALSLFSPPVQGCDKTISWFGDKVSLTLGIFGDHRAALIQTNKGVDCQHEILPALRCLSNVKLIIGLGFAYGLRNKSKLGDVLVSTYVDGVGNVRFEHDRMKFDEGRVRHTSISTDASNVFTKGTALWRSFTCSKAGRFTKAITGPLISSPTLLNGKFALNEYLKNNERFIGGEMEGQELARAQLSLRDNGREVDFIVIKGVADFGDGTKEKGWQLTASLAAASYAELKLQESTGEVYNCSKAEADTQFIRVARAEDSSSTSFKLKIINGKIKKCHGCKKEFRHRKKTLIPPYDLVVAHLEEKTYRDKSGKMVKDPKPGNRYYHLDFGCIRFVHTDIDASKFAISDSERSKLNDDHKKKLETLHMTIN